MLKEKNILDSMVLNFAKWMDIRKRVHSSNGGAVLSSIAEEITENINNSIMDYQSMFFIEKNLQNQDSVLSKAYYINIGKVDIEKVIISSPINTKIVDLKEFMICSNENLAYYEDGFLYFNKFFDSIIANINGYKINQKTSEFYIWNIYDEFALFCGIKRYQNETNRQLSNRITNRFNTVKNSSNEGIKNVILDSIMNLNIPIKEDEIRIERPTCDNLSKIYDEKNRVLDELNNINHDVYSTKRWNLDLWEHPFKTIKYMPCIYDALIDKYVNGIGDNDDLLIDIEKDSDITSADLLIYAKNEQKLFSYIKDKNIKSDIKLKLKKYNDDIKLKNNKYKITASKAIDITNNNIYIQGEKEENINDFENVENVISKDNNFSYLNITNNKILKKDHRYKFVFSPKTEFGYATISEFELKDDNGIYNLLMPKDGYNVVNGKLTSSTTKFYTTTVNDFYYYNNVVDYSDKIMVDSIISSGNLKLNVSNFKNNRLVVKHGSAMNSFTYDNLVCVNFTINNDFVNTVQSESEDQKVIFNREPINGFAFKLIKGSVTVQIKNGITTKTVTVEENTNFDSEKLLKPNMNFIITANSKDVIIKDLKYAKYELNMSLTKGELITLQDGTILLPDFQNENFLNIELKPIENLIPYIEFVHIGESIKNSIYSSEIIDIIDNDKTISVDTNCNITLMEYDISNTLVSTVTNYDSSTEYTAKDKILIKLDLSSYSEINKVMAENAKIEIFNNAYYIALGKNQTIRKIYISGKKNTLGPKFYINELLKLEIDSKLYCCDLIDGFVIEKNGTQEIKKILKEDMNSEYNDYVRIYNVPENCIGVFHLQDKTIINNSTSIDFISVNITPKNAINYIAYNEYNTVIELNENIEIVDLFNPLIDKNILLGYVVSTQEGTSVKFYEENVLFENSKDWTIGRKNISIFSNLLDDVENYNFETLELDIKAPLSQSIELDDMYSINSTMIDLKEYIIDSDDCEISYSRRQISDDIISESDYVHSFNFCLDNTMFKKLKHSNIDDILYIGTEPYEDGKTSNISKEDYFLYSDEGIIGFNDKTILNSQIFIIYSFKRAIRANIDINNLYTMVENNILAYNLVNTITLENIKNGFVYNLDNINYSDHINRVIVNFKTQGFDATKKNNVLIFTKIINKDILTVSPGYYYYGEKEYYYNTNTAKNTINKTDLITIVNGEVTDGMLKLSESSTNYTKNSYMQLGHSDVIHEIDFDKTKINLSNKMNILTPCDTIGNFKTFGINMYLTDGKNESAIGFKKNMSRGYATLNITKYIETGDNVSFLYSGENNIYIYSSCNNDSSLYLEKHCDFVFENYDESYSRAYVTINNVEKNKEYFITVMGDCVIDDILISKDEINTGSHIKNIDFFNLYFKEPNVKNNKLKRIINGELGYKQDISVSQNNVISMCPKIKFGTTLVKRYDKNNSFNELNFQNINKESLNDDMYLTTLNTEGNILSDAIFIGNSKTIHKLKIQLNSIKNIYDENIKIKVFASYFKNKDYNLIKEESGTSVSIPSSYINGAKYIKFSVILPKNYIIENIDMLIDYKEDVENMSYVSESYSNSGYYETIVYDTGYEKDYILSGLGISNVEKLSNISLEITGAKKSNDKLIWYPYKKIELDAELNIINNILLNDIYYFKLRATLNHKDAAIKIDYIELTGGEE